MGETTGAKYLMVCNSCNARNRVGQEHAGLTGKCGKCGAPFIASSCVPIKVTDLGWEEEVIGSVVPAIVEVWSPGCGVCSKYEPQVREMAASLCGKVRVLQLNVDENPRTGARYFVKAVPTLLLFRAGKLLQAMTGPQPVQTLRQVLGV